MAENNSVSFEQAMEELKELSPELYNQFIKKTEIEIVAEIVNGSTMDFAVYDCVRGKLDD